MARATQPQAYDDDQQAEGEPLPAGPYEGETFTDMIVHKTPWWFISVFIHAIAFTICALIVVIAKPIEDTEIVTVQAPKPPPPEPEIEKPKDLEQTEKTVDIKAEVDDPIFKKAEESDRTESDNNEDFRENKGDSPNEVSDKPYKGPGLNDSIGSGGGGGGRYGHRLGGKANLVKKAGGSNVTEEAVKNALKWLARHQSADGSWAMKKYLDQCGRVGKYQGKCDPDGIHASVDVVTHNFDVGNTSLALLAFLGAGHTHTSKETYDGINFGDVVRNGLQYLLRVQDGDGCVGSKDVEQFMYNHTIAALALSEAYGLTGSNKFKDKAQKAIDYIIASQNPGKAWRYIYQAGENDTSVTGWAVMALKSADLSGLSFDKNVAYDGARAWLESVAYKAEGSGTGGTTRWKAGYQAPIDADVAIPGINDTFNSKHPSMTAIAVMSRIFMDKKRNEPKVAGGAAVLLEDLPKWDKNEIDFYYWYYASLALYQFDGPDGSHWKKWNKEMIDALVKNQNKEAEQDKAGSWEPVCRWSCKGGRVYGTAINALTLEVYYRYASVFGGKAEAGGK
jgi:hypothetical protein